MRSCVCVCVCLSMHIARVLRHSAKGLGLTKHINNKTSCQVALIARRFVLLDLLKQFCVLDNLLKAKGCGRNYGDIFFNYFIGMRQVYLRAFKLKQINTDDME